MTVKEYTKEFYKIIRSGNNEDGDKAVARYVNGLKYAIQDELNIVKICVGNLICLGLRLLFVYLYYCIYHSRELETKSHNE